MRRDNHKETNNNSASLHEKNKKQTQADERRNFP